MQVFCFKHFLYYVQLDEMVDSYYISMSYNDSQNLEFQITPISLKKNKQKTRNFVLIIWKRFSNEILNYILDKYM